MSSSRPSGAPPAESAEPDGPQDLRGKDWWAAVKRTVREFSSDSVTDWAAALTYYAMLSIFPGLLVLLSLIGLAGESTTDELITNLGQAAPGSVREIILVAVDNLQDSRGTAGITAVVAFAAAFWSASGYIAAFMRASNAIYDVPEGRPVWKTLPIRLGITLLVTALLAITGLAVVLTGTLARHAGDLVGVGSTAVTVWDIAKWPVLVLIVSFIFALLYWASPNAKQGFRWVSPGGILAVLLWLTASAAFAIYVANFGSYNKTYGSLASVIIFLVWLWISNIAILVGAELNAELRTRPRHRHGPSRGPRALRRTPRRRKDQGNQRHVTLIGTCTQVCFAHKLKRPGSDAHHLLSWEGDARGRAGPGPVGVPPLGQCLHVSGSPSSSASPVTGRRRPPLRGSAPAQIFTTPGPGPVGAPGSIRRAVLHQCPSCCVSKDSGWGFPAFGGWQRAGLDEPSGDLAQLDVVVLGAAAQHRERTVGVQVEPFRQNALRLADQPADLPAPAQRNRPPARLGHLTVLRLDPELAPDQ